MSALVLDRIRARCRAAEALRDRPPFVPPPAVSEPAAPVSFDRWQIKPTFRCPSLLFPAPKL